MSIHRAPTLDRRALLTRGAALAGATALARSALARVARPAPRRRLVLLQLSGGNDGLSTVVPWSHTVYRRARAATRLDESELLVLDHERALHGELRQLAARWRAGDLAIVEGVGYPEMRRSHFASLEVWHAADPRGRAAGDGWIGRLAAAAWADEDHPELIVHLGGEAPWSVRSTLHPPVAIASPTALRWFGAQPDARLAAPRRRAGEERHAGRDAALERLRGRLLDARDSSRSIRTAALAHRPRVEYPRDELGATLRDVAALIRGGLGTRVFSLAFGGFDTHADQRAAHGARMRALDGALGAFLLDLEDAGAYGDTTVLVFSEFGRRVAENASRGTDHGKAGPVLVLGAGVRGGLYGAPPSLTDLDDGDLAPTTDFRRAYAAVIEDWFGADPAAVFEGEHAPLAIFGRGG